MTNSEVLQKVLPVYMKRFGMNQTDFANSLGVSRATVHCWLHGKAFPRMKEIEKMARIFGCKTDDLLATRRMNFPEMSQAISPYVLEMIDERVTESMEDTELEDLWFHATPAAKKAALAVLRSMDEGDDKK